MTELERLQNEARQNFPTRAHELEAIVALSYQAGRDAAVDYIRGMSAYKPVKRERYSHEKHRAETYEDIEYQVFGSYLDQARLSD